ncbi:putative outer membrane starch-binding protein [Arcticibacter pallidicorallinus]|uniref:Putative outer membrane starch-binding protein n=1 Tax=Arcticibacter pallidicorallinus TaxID=1259464 RepID=A0A2T0TS96_9SPHI|nr:RagB/SusD family nutrient uptake outer membrane protein [Arcticibacter pallidicorallinus]PRY48592.1 putative outer membrane starch-binding protein [Arcticibacter pallidicorallinus]
MKNISKYLALCLVLTLSIASCKKDYLEREPTTIVTDEQLWKDPKLIVGLLANYYNRLPTDMGLNDQGGSQWRNMADYDDGMWSGSSNDEWRNNIVSYDRARWRLYDYGFVRDLNLAIENVDKFGAATLNEAQRTQLKAEFRFIRAYLYFEMVKRMGGVPLITTQLLYDFSGDPTYLQQPRAKEAEVYDFIAAELDAIKNDIGNGGSTGRANRYTCMALKSRAMLYAGTIAKYNALLTPNVVTPGGEVGIPAARAAEYLQKSLDASKEVIAGPYSLYKNNPNLGENFYEAIVKKTNNPEVIFVRDFLSSKAKKHFFTYENIARGIREDNLSSSSIVPSLNLVENYEYLDGSPGVLRTRNAANTDYIYYNNTTEIFANKDARLYGTVIYPGAPFRGLTVDMQAGVMRWDANSGTYQTIEGPDLGTNYSDGKPLIAASGPHRSIQEVSNTGFYLRKYVDANGGASTRGIQSDVWWVWFRLGEIYLNAAEAAFELGFTGDALTYANAIRERAGFPANSLTPATLTIEKIRNDRRNELAFEDHRVWDLKRWRQADKVWNGNANNPEDVVYALYPYRVVRPGDPARDGKYVFVKMRAPKFGAPRFFQIFNYYSSIDQGVINSNPKIVPNPFN